MRKRYQQGWNEVALRRLSKTLALIGVASIVWVPAIYLSAKLRGEGTAPGQTRPVLFYSPDCAECVRSEPLIGSLLEKQGWREVERVDARLVSALSLRDQFDAAFRVPDALRGHTPALFHAGGYVIGEGQVRVASLTGLPHTRAFPSQAGSGFQWSLWADSLITGLSLLLMGCLMGPHAKVARIAGMLLLSTVLLAAGIGKLLHPAAFVRAVEQMGLFPLFFVRASWLVGTLETGLGAALAFPRPRLAALHITFPLLAGFLILSVVLLIHGYSGNCGCMPWVDELRPWVFGRDVALLGLSGTLSVKRRIRSRPQGTTVSAGLLSPVCLRKTHVR